MRLEESKSCDLHLTVFSYYFTLRRVDVPKLTYLLWHTYNQNIRKSDPLIQSNSLEIYLKMFNYTCTLHSSLGTTINIF